MLCLAPFVILSSVTTGAFWLSGLGSVSEVEKVTLMALIYKVLFPSISTLETLPSCDARGLSYAVVRGGQHVSMLLRPMRHLRLLLSLLSGLLFSVPSAAALDVGDKAPDFTLPSTTGEPISLQQFLGKNTSFLSSTCGRSA